MITTHHDKAFIKQAKYYDRRHRDLQFKVGDLVKKPNNVLSSAKDKIATKLAPKFTGPYVVVEVVSPNVHTLASQDGRLAGRYHGPHLQKFMDNDDGEDVDPNKSNVNLSSTENFLKFTTQTQKLIHIGIPIQKLKLTLGMGILQINRKSNWNLHVECDFIIGRIRYR